MNEYVKSYIEKENNTMVWGHDGVFEIKIIIVRAFQMISVPHNDEQDLLENKNKYSGFFYRSFATCRWPLSHPQSLSMPVRDGRAFFGVDTRASDCCSSNLIRSLSSCLMVEHPLLHLVAQSVKLLWIAPVH